MLGLAEAKPVHARWAQANGDYLDFVARNPEYLERAAYRSIYDAEWLRKLTIQPWPLFVDAAQRHEMRDVARGVDGVMRGAIARFLENDPAEVAAFYASDDAEPEGGGWTFSPDEDFLAMLLEEPDGVTSAASRGDYIEDREGLKLVEYNAGGFLGGIQVDAIAELYVASAPTARFLAEQGRRAQAQGVLRAYFRHVAESTAASGVWRGGEPLNTAFMMLPNEPVMVALHSRELYEREYARALADAGIREGGKVLLCGGEELVESGGWLTVRGHRVHALLEHYQGVGDIRAAFRYFKLGRLNLFSGPIGNLMSDKRNLALVSEQEGSDEFTAAEREVIRRHLPWTRRVRPMRTTWRGRPFRLPEDLVARREELVLKKACSIGGSYVHVGRFRSDDEWARVVARALRDGDWIVQEYLETVPYVFQRGETGAGRVDMVWGLFVFGEHYGGAVLRMQPAGSGTGVVNQQTGAEVGAMVDLV
ncbi:MAG: hypothetical protein ACJ8J0_05380 [Longimicrobiaceae bacterium]